MQSLYLRLMKFVNSCLMSFRHLMKLALYESMKNILLLSIFSFSTKQVNLVESSKLNIFAKLRPLICLDLSKYFQLGLVFCLKSSLYFLLCRSTCLKFFIWNICSCSTSLSSMYLAKQLRSWLHAQKISWCFQAAADGFLLE